jgi:hypothetical protein
MMKLENHSHSIRPSVEIQDSVTSDLSQIAQTVNLLYNASAISIRTAVQMVHHDMTEEQIEFETKRIMAERGIKDPVPSQLET